MEPYKLFCKFYFKRYLFCLCFLVLIANHKCSLLFILSNCSKINFQGHSRLNDRTSLGSGFGSYISPPPHHNTHARTQHSSVLIYTAIQPLITDPKDSLAKVLISEPTVVNWVSCGWELFYLHEQFTHGRFSSTVYSNSHWQNSHIYLEVSDN